MTINNGRLGKLGKIYQNTTQCFPQHVLHLRFSVDSFEKCAGSWSRRSLGSELAVHIENDRKEPQKALWLFSGAAGVKVVKNYYLFL